MGDHQIARVQPSDNAPSGEFGAKLRLDGVQKKWGRESYTSSSTPSSSTSSQQAVNGASNSDSISSQGRESSYGSKKQQVTEVSEEKQRLAASLFGSAAKADRKAHAGRRTAKESSSTEKVTVANAAPQPAKEQVVPAVPPPDLMDLGEPIPPSAPLADPFSQLDGLLGPASSSPVVSGTSVPSTSDTPDLMSIFSDDTTTGSSEAAVGAQKGATAVAAKKGHSLQDALQKDATARQVGVTPTGNNPNLFKDLLG
jgi:AP-4 complex subunit epsilon-1